MKAINKWHDEVWTERYGHVCPAHQGKIVRIQGTEGKDTYNPAMYEDGQDKILAFRAENRKSNILTSATYHPSICFARLQGGQWRIDPKMAPFDMLEDPFIFYVEEKGIQKVVLGGVRARMHHKALTVQTEFYKGDTLENLERISFAVVHNMKDVRLLQLPDNRFLLCRRPHGDKYKRGRIALHVLDSLDDLTDVDMTELPTLAMLDSCQDALDWVGVNNAYILKDNEGRAWLGLLGHIALEDKDKMLHYAACTYKISLQDLLDNQIHKICPQIIATRACFEAGPSKAETISDIVFPGHLEHVDQYTYRLWVGLSDTRIGVIELEDPFRLKQDTAPVVATDPQHAAA